MRSSTGMSSSSSRLRCWRGVSSSSATTTFASASLSSGLELVDLARAEVVVRVRLVALLHQLADGGDTGGPQQLLELLEILVLRRGGDAEGALLGPAGVWRRGVAGLGVRPLRERSKTFHSTRGYRPTPCPSAPAPSDTEARRAPRRADARARRHPVASRATRPRWPRMSRACCATAARRSSDLGDSCVLAARAGTRPRVLLAGPPGHGAGAGQHPGPDRRRRASTGSARAT